MSTLLEQELKTFSANLESLLGANEGRFVVIHDARIIGTFDSQMDAVTAGYRELGNVPFLVKQVIKVEAPLNFVSNLLGV